MPSMNAIPFNQLLPIFVIGSTILLCACSSSNNAVALEPPAASAPLEEDKPVNEKGLEKAMLSAGCFWHVESDLQDLPGVKATTVGYTGGSTECPTYPVVCEGKTGHAEAVEVFFDPKRISYEQLLNQYFDIHDASSHEADPSFHGGQYRSEIFYYNDTQKQIAERVKKEREQKAHKKFHTAIEPVAKFTRAEDYHQNYLKVRGLKQCN